MVMMMVMVMMMMMMMMVMVMMMVMAMARRICDGDDDGDGDDLDHAVDCVMITKITMDFPQQQIAPNCPKLPQIAPNRPDHLRHTGQP